MLTFSPLRSSGVVCRLSSPKPIPKWMQELNGLSSTLLPPLISALAILCACVDADFEMWKHWQQNILIFHLNGNVIAKTFIIVRNQFHCILLEVFVCLMVVLWVHHCALYSRQLEPTWTTLLLPFWNEYFQDTFTALLKSKTTWRALLGPSPGWKWLLPLSHLRHYAKWTLTPW